MDVELRLSELGLALPPPPSPVAAYLLSRRSGGVLFLSGTTCYTEDGLLYKGRLGDELTIDQGYAAARQTLLNLLSVVKAEIGNLDNVDYIIKLNGFVNSSPGFFQQPEVINGASDLLVQIYGDRGKHARTSIGVISLPDNIPVEIEMILQIKENV